MDEHRTFARKSSGSKWEESRVEANEKPGEEKEWVIGMPSSLWPEERREIFLVKGWNRGGVKLGRERRDKWSGKTSDWRNWNHCGTWVCMATEARRVKDGVMMKRKTNFLGPEVQNLCRSHSCLVKTVWVTGARRRQTLRWKWKQYRVDLQEKGSECHANEKWRIGL